MKALVSTTTRSGGIVGQDGPEFLLGHPARGSSTGDALAEALKLRYVEPPQAVIFLRRQQHRYIAFLTMGSFCAASRRSARRCLAYVAET